MKIFYSLAIYGLIAVPASLSAPQAPGGGFELVRSSIDAGGARSVGGGFALHGTLAQGEADPQPASGGGFALRGGFWVAGAPPGEQIFVDGFESGGS